tara:strand:- start:121 stop:474 length:354 start_codon:yes stop_codon:yes gene_type:complete
MAIAATCDIPLALEKLGLNHCQYGLTQSVPPHSIRWWNCVDPQPTDDEINNAWYTIPDTSYIDNRIGFATTDGYPAITDQLDQLYHDMTDGKLGVAATTGSWYVGITSVKVRHPKPS